MSFLSAEEKTRVSEAIAAAERKTSGEFVAVLAEASASYLFFPMLWTAVAGLIVPGALLVAGADWGLLANYALQIAVFIVAALICFRDSVRPRLVPKHIRRARASEAAYEQFYLRGIHRTENHSGVLLFVSAAEHHVEIVADAGIHANVGEERWQAIVDTFTANVKGGHVADGFTTAAASIGDAMASHYPRAADDVNELPNGLIEI